MGGGQNGNFHFTVTRLTRRLADEEIHSQSISQTRQHVDN